MSKVVLRLCLAASGYPLGLELKTFVIHHVGAGNGAHHSSLKEQPVFLATQSSLKSQLFLNVKFSNISAVCSIFHHHSSLVPFHLESASCYYPHPQNTVLLSVSKFNYLKYLV